MRPRLTRIQPLLLILMAFLPSLAAATQCGASRTPGATLVFPYFEVDLASPQGLRTLISIQNVSAEAVLTNVVVWTNCGPPILSFNLALKAQSSRPIDVHDLLTTGTIPISAEDTSFPDCAGLVSGQSLDEAQIDRLQARLTGQPDPVDGLCYSEALEPATRAVGYITADVVTRCSDTIRTPIDEGYFTRADAPQIAASDNVLWGDLFLIDGQGDLAQGFEAVSLVADASIAEESPTSGFYRAGDDRQPLSTRYRTRFFQGGGFNGSTELLIWVEPFLYKGFDCASPLPCDIVPFYSPGELARTEKAGSGPIGYTTEVLALDEAGEQVFHRSVNLQNTTTRLQVGNEGLRIDARSGSLELGYQWSACAESLFVKCPPRPTFTSSIQGWLQPIYTAEGRFSVGLNAAALENSCPEVEEP